MNKQYQIWLSGTAILFGGAMVLIGFILSAQSTELLANGQHGRAVIESKSRHLMAGGSYPQTEYSIVMTLPEYPGKQLFWRPLREEWDKYRRGDILDIIFDPENPGDFFVGKRAAAGPLRQQGLYAIYLGSAIAAIGLAFAILGRRRHRPRA